MVGTIVLSLFKAKYCTGVDTLGTARQELISDDLCWMMTEALPSQGNDHVSFDEDGEVSLSPMPPPPLRFSSYSLLEVSGMFVGKDAYEVSLSTCSERTNDSEVSRPNRSDLWSRADCRTLFHFTSARLGSTYHLAWHHPSRNGW